MDLLALDANFAPLNYFKFIELQWNRKFYEPGDFSVQILYEEYDPSAKFVQLIGRPELGLIQKVEYSESSDGIYVQLSGFFAEKLPDEKITFPTFSAENQTIESFFSSVWNQYINNSDLAIEYHMRKLEPESLNAARISKMSTGDSITTMLCEALKPSEIGLTASLDNLNVSLNFSIKKGKNLTQDNTEGNNFVVFSEFFGNLQGATYIEDNSGYKNYAVVQGEGEGTERRTVYVDLSNGQTKRQLYVDARDLRQEEGISIADYEAQLRQRGIEKLSETVDITNLETNIVSNAGFDYMIDYDLGDMVDIEVSMLGKSCQAQIIEASEVISGMKHDVTLTFGDEVPTIWKKARIR